MTKMEDATSLKLYNKQTLNRDSMVRAEFIAEFNAYI